MHQDKTVAQILLIFSVANVALAVPTVVRQRNPVTGGLDDESTDRSGSEPMPELVSDSDLAPESLDDSPLESPARSSHQDSLPASPAVYSYPNSVFDSSTDSSGSIEEWESPGFHWPDFASIHDSAPGSPSGSSDHDLAPPEPVTFFNDALKTKLKIYASLGAVVGVSAGLVYEVHKRVKDTRSHGAYVSPLFPPSEFLFCRHFIESQTV